MQVTKEPLDPCQVALTIEVDEDKVVHATDQAYREYAKYVSVPGFRKGKAPMHYIRQRVPAAEVRQRLAEILVEPAYAEALAETKIIPYSQPELELVQLEESKPFIFKAVVPLAPEVELGKYSEIKIDRHVYSVPEAAIDEEIERRREKAATYPQVERPVQNGDLVIADVSAKVEGLPNLAEPQGTMIEIGGDNIPGFDEQIIGLAPTEEKTFPITYPEDYPDPNLQGQYADFTIKVKEVRERVLPALDDELAKAQSSGKAETVGDWRTQIRAEAEALMVRRSATDLENRLLQVIVDNSKVSFPPLILNGEVEHEIKALKKQLDRNGMTVEEYAMRQETTTDAIVEQMKAEADHRIKAGLILGEVADKENLAINDDDVSAAIAEQAVEENSTPAAVRALHESRGTMDSLRNRVQTRKVLDFLCNSAVTTDVQVSPEDDGDDDESAKTTVAAPKAKAAKSKKASE